MAHVTANRSPDRKEFLIAIGAIVLPVAIVGVALLLPRVDPITLAGAAVGFIGLLAGFAFPSFLLRMLLVGVTIERFIAIQTPLGRFDAPRIITIGLIAALFVSRIFRREPIIGPPKSVARALYLLLSVWIASSVVSIVVGQDTTINVFIDESTFSAGRYTPFLKSYTEIVALGLPLLTPIFMLTIVRNLPDLRLAVKFWLFGAAAVCLMGVYTTIAYYVPIFPIHEDLANTGYSVGGIFSISRIRSWMFEPRHLAVYLATVLPFLFATSSTRSYVFAPFMHVTVTVMVTLVFVLTMAKAALVLLPVIIPVLIVLSGLTESRDRFGAVLKYGAIVTISFAAVMALASGIFMSYNEFVLEDVLDVLSLQVIALFDDSNISTGVQAATMVAAFNMFLAFPISGVGIGNWVFFASTSILPTWWRGVWGVEWLPIAIPSLYFQTMAETGVIGLFAVGILLATIFRIGLNNLLNHPNITARYWSAGLLTSLVGILGANIFTLRFYKTEAWIVIGFILLIDRWRTEKWQEPTLERV